MSRRWWQHDGQPGQLDEPHRALRLGNRCCASYCAVIQRSAALSSPAASPCCKIVCSPKRKRARVFPVSRPRLFPCRENIDEIIPRGVGPQDTESTSSEGMSYLWHASTDMLPRRNVSISSSKLRPSNAR